MNNKDTASQSQAVPSELASLLRGIAEDPMLADHVHISKSTLMEAVAEIDRLSHSAATGKVPTDAEIVDAVSDIFLSDYDSVAAYDIAVARAVLRLAASPAAPLAGKAEPNIPDLPLWHYNEHSKTIHPDPCGEWVRADTARHAILTSVMFDRKARKLAPAELAPIQASASQAVAEPVDPDALELARADQSPIKISNAELAAFHRFCDCCEDSDAGGHDVPKPMMSQLVRLGLLRPAGPGRHETTVFGDWLRDCAAPVAQQSEAGAPTAAALDVALDEFAREHRADAFGQPNDADAARRAIHDMLSSRESAAPAAPVREGDREQDAKDAARYRWTRDKGCNFVWCEIGAGNFRTGLDEAIDAAMQKGAQHNG